MTHHVGQFLCPGTDLFGPLAVQHLDSGLLTSPTAEGMEHFLELEEAGEAQVEKHGEDDIFTDLGEAGEPWKRRGFTLTPLDVAREEDERLNLGDPDIREVATDSDGELADDIAVGFEAHAFMTDEEITEEIIHVASEMGPSFPAQGFHSGSGHCGGRGRGGLLGCSCSSPDAANVGSRTGEVVDGVLHEAVAEIAVEDDEEAPGADGGATKSL